MKINIIRGMKFWPKNLRSFLGKFWKFLKPPMNIKEAKQKGLAYFGLIILFYLVRDTILYILIPLLTFNAVF